MAHVCKTAGLKLTALPEGVRLRRRGDLMFAVNYGETMWTAPFKGKRVLGSQRVGPQQVSCWLEPS
jgi:beta-galactosidase